MKPFSIIINKKNLQIILLLVFIFINNKLIFSQEKSPAVFGKISLQDFDLSKYKIDSGAAAIIIADVGEAHYEKDRLLGYRLIFTHYKRVKILNKNGFGEATEMIPLSSNGHDGEKLLNLKAFTYNIENNQVVKVKLDDKSVFLENVTTAFGLTKFTMPALKEGSIFEYSYSVESPILFSLKPWIFQGKYPCLWSEYNASIPEIFNYVYLQQGYNPYFIHTQQNDIEYTINVSKHHWVMKDIQPLREEKYTSTLSNYISKIEFQLASVNAPGFSRTVLSNWPDVSRQLMNDEYFGADLLKTNNWLNDDLKQINKNAKNDLEKARNIYVFVRDNFKCTQPEGSRSSNSLKTTFKNKSGTSGEINLVLCAMLNAQGIHSDPIILSTKNHGFVNEIYPLINRYNYLICDAVIDGTNYYYLDASRQFLSFNHLPDYCYNGQARIINEENADAVYFNADSLKEKKITSVFITNDEKKPNDITGSFQSDLGYYEAYDLREKLSDKKADGFFKNVRSLFTGDAEITDAGIDSLSQIDEPINVHFEFNFKNAAAADILYFNPMLSEALKENPFKLAERKYPVEMPYKIDNAYVLDMELPKGYDIDEIPKSSKVLLNDNDGFFEYIITRDDNNIHLRSWIKLNKANFQMEDYNSLRDFFAFIVKKQSEQIVFKKKK